MKNLINRTSREQFVMDAINKQFEITGRDKSTLETDREWYSNNTMSDQQWMQWKDWFISEVRKRFKLTKKAAVREFAFFDLSYGFKIVNENCEN